MLESSARAGTGFHGSTQICAMKQVASFFKRCWIIIWISDIFKNRKCLFLHFYYRILRESRGWKCHSGSCREPGDKELISSFRSMRRFLCKYTLWSGCCLLQSYFPCFDAECKADRGKASSLTLLQPSVPTLWSYGGEASLDYKAAYNILSKVCMYPCPNICKCIWSGAVFQGLG